MDNNAIYFIKAETLSNGKWIRENKMSFDHVKSEEHFRNINVDDE